MIHLLHAAAVAYSAPSFAPRPATAVAEIARPLWGLKAGRLTFEAPQPRLLRP